MRIVEAGVPLLIALLLLPQLFPALVPVAVMHAVRLIAPACTMCSGSHCTRGRGSRGGRGNVTHLRCRHLVAETCDPHAGAAGGVGEAVAVAAEAEHSRSQDLLEPAIQPEINEWVVADGGHGEPVDPDQKVVVFVPVLKVNQEVVQVVRQPADGKDDGHQQQHDDRPLLGHELTILLFPGSGSDRGPGPDLDPDPGVQADHDGERDPKLEDEGDDIDRFLVQVLGFGVDDATADICFTKSSVLAHTIEKEERQGEEHGDRPNGSDGKQGDDLRDDPPP